MPHTYQYQLYGLRVISEIALPLPEATDLPFEHPDCLINALPLESAPGKIPDRTVSYGDEQENAQCLAWDLGAQWLVDTGLAAFHFEGKHIRAYVHDHADTHILGLVIVGQVLIYFLQNGSVPVLHASAVETPHGAVAFLGPKGQGKSTMAAQFLSHGFPLISDDSLPLRLHGHDIMAVPAVPTMKMWEDTEKNALNLSAPLPYLAPGHPKKLMQLTSRSQFSSTSSPLRRIYVLHRGRQTTQSDIRIDPTSARDSLAQLITHLSWRRLLSARQVAELLPALTSVAQRVPLAALHYPDGHGDFDQVKEFILTDLREGSRY